MKTYEILQEKGCLVHSISPEATLEDVVAALVEHNIGSLLVEDGEGVVGIITERDILRTCATDVRPLDLIGVRERMTQSVVVGRPEDDVSDVMGLLTEKRIRHLPIMEDTDVVGIISIGDVVKAQHDQLTLENAYLKSYIRG